MVTYQYTAVDAAGKELAGEVTADSRITALDILHKRGLLPVDVSEGARSSRNGSFISRARAALSEIAAEKIRLRELVSLTYSLAALLKAGLTVDRALSIAASLERREVSRKFFEDLARSVRTGVTFTESLRATNVEMPSYFLSMVQAGEVGGTLPPTLARVADLLRKQLEVRERIQSALVYPMLLAGVVLVTLIILIAFVLPRFQVLFAESEAPLPLSTTIVLTVGAFAGTYWWLLLALIGIAIVALRKYFKTSKGRARWDGWMLNSRWTLGLPAALDTARLLRTVGTLLQSAVPLASALRVAEGTLSNRQLQKGLTTVIQRVKAGESFTTALAAADGFPSQAIQLARVGEETGRLEDMLMEAANILDNDSQRNLERLLTLLVPILTIAMGLIVAALIGSVLVGLLSINELAF